MVVQSWGSDGPISMPEPLDRDQLVYVDMGGLCMTLHGIAHRFTQADWEAYVYPRFAPPDVPGGEG